MCFPYLEASFTDTFLHQILELFQMLFIDIARQGIVFLAYLRCHTDDLSHHSSCTHHSDGA